MSNKNKGRNGIVYSTNPDFQFEAEQEEDTLSPEQQRLYVRREVRNGKPCVVIKDFIGRNEDLKLLEKLLKNHCGTGGSSKDGDILIQGDILDKVRQFLQSKGYKTKG
jgi:translation initiation factor 1